MKNLLLRQRIVRLISMSYALSEDYLWKCYEKIENIEKLLNLLEDNRLQEINDILSKDSHS